VQAQSADSATDELRKQIEELTAKVEQLQNRQDTQASAAEVDATIQRVLADAEKRSQLLQMEGFTAGWNNGFKLQSADGNFLLQPYFQLQVRNVTTFRDGAKNGGDEIQNGFEIRRMRLGFKGNMFTPDLTYNFRWATNRNDGDIQLENAYVQYFFTADWAVKLGQWKDNWTHEETVSSTNQLAVDRSLLNELIGGGQTDYVQGIALLYHPRESEVRAEFAFIDGYSSKNTDFQDDPSSAGTALIGVGSAGLGEQGDNFGLSGRVEYAFMGNWKAYDQFTAMGATGDLLVLGAGFNWTQASSNNVYFYTVDSQWLPASVVGLSVYGAFVGAYQDLNSAGIAGNFNNWGFLVQAGYMLNEQWELFGRVDYTDFDDEGFGTDSENEFWETTVGLNYYMRGQAAKFTVDLNWLCNGTPGGVNLTGIGYQPSDGSEISLRAQFQLLL
jgi:hypothetical protein